MRLTSFVLLFALLFGAPVASANPGETARTTANRARVARAARPARTPARPTAALGRSARPARVRRVAAPTPTVVRDAVAVELATVAIENAQPVQYQQAFDWEASPFRVRVRLSGQSEPMDALYLPRAAWRRTANTPEHHVVAYELNQAIGMDVVPPTVMRDGMAWTSDAGEARTTDAGALLLRPRGEEGLWNYAGRFASETPRWLALFASDVRVLDVLMNKVRTDPGSYMMGTHWRTGQQSAYVVEFEATQPLEEEGRWTRLDRPDRYTGDPIRVVRRATLNGLRSLTERGLSARLGANATPAQVRGILARRDRLVGMFEALIAEHGEASVVFDAAAAAAIPAD